MALAVGISDRELLPKLVFSEFFLGMLVIDSGWSAEQK